MYIYVHMNIHMNIYIGNSNAVIPEVLTEYVHGVNYMQMAALGISTMSIITKEALYHYTLRVGKDTNSDSVKANAWQHRRCLYTYTSIRIYLYSYVYM
jgi:divalent metal cation (Fe/Co/Zn/Cd) transporter